MSYIMKNPVKNTASFVSKRGFGQNFIYWEQTYTTPLPPSPPTIKADFDICILIRRNEVSLIELVH